MDPDITRTAETLADHALVLLAIGVALVAFVLVGIVAAVRLARRYQARLGRVVAWLFVQVHRIPRIGPRLRATRVVVPPRYVFLHLVLGLVATAGVVAFVIIAEEALAGHAVAQFDYAFAAALHDSASPRWREVFRIVTWFGSDEVLGVLSAIIAVALLIQRELVLAIGWIIAQAGGGFLNVTLKRAFERSRPDLPDAVHASGWGFPSGHAMGTFIFCGVGAYLALRFIRSTNLRVIVVVAASTACLVIGFTRLYLGAHYLSDVAAALFAAAAWVAVCVSGMELARGARVEGRGLKSARSSPLDARP